MKNKYILFEYRFYKNDLGWAFVQSNKKIQLIFQFFTIFFLFTFSFGMDGKISRRFVFINYSTLLGKGGDFPWGYAKK